jgi:hypothetical protein
LGANHFAVCHAENSLAKWPGRRGNTRLSRAHHSGPHQLHAEFKVGENSPGGIFRLKAG